MNHNKPMYEKLCVFKKIKEDLEEEGVMNHAS